MSNKYFNYRVDIVKKVKCLEEYAEIPKGFSPTNTGARNHVMHTGENKKLIEIRCLKKLINNAIDTFGFDIEIVSDKDDGDVIIKLSDISP